MCLQRNHFCNHITDLYLVLKRRKRSPQLYKYKKCEKLLEVQLYRPFRIVPSSCNWLCKATLQLLQKSSSRYNRVALLLTSAKIPLADAEIETKVPFLWQGGEKRLVLPIPGKSVFLKMHEELEADLRAFHKEKDESCSTQTG